MTHAARPKYDPVVCDLDGTLVDSGPAIVATVRAACESVGVSWKDMDLSSAVGPPLVTTFGRLLPDRRLIPPALDAYRSIYVEEVKRSAVPMPGALGALEAMFRDGVALGVATYKLCSVAEIVLQAAGMRPYFRAVVGWTDDADGRDKAALVAEALELIAPHRSAPLYVGDLDADEEAATRVGIAFLRLGPLSWDDILAAVIAGHTRPT